MKKIKPALGWREWANLPELSRKKIKVKVDTGARTSSLHAVNIKITGEKRRTVHFDFNPDQDGGKLIHCKLPLVDERKVKSSNGISSLRPVIEVDITIGEHSWPIEITLVDRDMMGFRMLLGRQAMRDKFLVDPGESFLLGKANNKK
ncbi:MAG: ATP-dependent zinc protease family protein [Bdellovibrionales bacterium]